MNNLSLLCRVLQLQRLGALPKESARALKDVYLVSGDGIDRYIALSETDECKAICNLNLVRIAKRWGATYGADAAYGRDADQKFMLEAKERAYRNLEEIDGEPTVEKLLVSPMPKAWSLAGQYFLIEGNNEELGKNLLLQAAEQKDIDALLWKICAFPHSAEETIKTLAGLPQFVKAPELLSPWLKKYGVDLDGEVVYPPKKIGFGR